MLAPAEAPSIDSAPIDPVPVDLAPIKLAPPESCQRDPASPACAADVARGVQRLLLTRDLMSMAEVPLDNGRRADVLGVDAKGGLAIVEVKVSRADLMGDAKWPDYLACCDRYYWAVPAGFDLSLFDQACLLPARCGLIVADRYGAEVVREAATESVPAHVRRRVTLAFARRAARRFAGVTDPDGFLA